MKKQKISGKVLKKGRKWLKIVQTGKNEKYPDDLLINDVTRNFTEGQEFTDLLVETEFETKYTGGYKITHTAVTEESIRDKNIEKWWGYVKAKYQNDGYIYKRGVEELQALDCHDYDEQIAAMKRNVDIKNAIFWLRDNYEKRNYISEKNVQTLHDYDVHEYDDEIDEMRKNIAAKRAGVDVREPAKEKLKTIVERADINDRRENGSYIRQDEKVYEVQKSRFDNGESAGTPWDNYIYFCKDVTETADAQEFLARSKEREEKTAKINAVKQSISEKFKQIREYIEEHDILKKAEVELPQGKLIFDSFNAYGGGQRIVDDGECIWFIQNNGGDDDFWAVNHISTGSGAGCYGWKCEKKDVEKLIKEYLSLKENLEELSK